ncbi:6120_t:CDS:2 [Ambispora gerdemannii]|uniref:Acireductone dioxygenase n=1 Tax=Ambispora gerdemannii TaxID=144530 RepID=A0A9N8Z7N6_9GLOM|nr:6120_t:CDS:2 [Ambispora gerdemannii]
MRAYYYNEEDNSDPREPHEFSPSSPVTPEELAQLGVVYCRIEIENYENEINRIAKERDYKNRDVINCSKEGLGELYESKLKTFFEEHLHEDEEIRFILDGSGYFDVRDQRDRWIRIVVVPGDLIVLPAGIYHRFTLDNNNFIKALRLFKEEPKWTPINRPADNNPFRIQYLKSIALP